MNSQFRLKKKLLIISSWAPPMVGGPQNLYNLFSQVNSSDYALLTSRLEIQAAERNGVRGSWLQGKYFYFDEDDAIAASIHPTTQTNKLTIAQKIFRLAVIILRKIPYLGRGIIGVTNVSRQINKIRVSFQQLRSTFDGEMLMGISDMGQSILATAIIGKTLRIPYTYYFFDLYRGNLLPRPYNWFAKLEGWALRNAKVLILTNEITEEYYKKRYGSNIRTAVVHNSIFDRHTINTYNAQSPYVIVFTGNVYWAQEQSVMNLITAMNKLTDLPIKLKMYVPNPPESLKTAVAGKANIELGAAKQDDMPSIQGSATLLFLPLAWDTKAPDIIATATPGKFTDYLASGRPMLVHAPEYAYVSKYTKEHSLGLVVDTNSVEALATAIRNFLAHPEQGKAYVDNALRVFAANHEATKNAAKLTELLNLLD